MLKRLFEPSVREASRPPVTKKRKIINLTIFFCISFYIAMAPLWFYLKFEFFPHPYNEVAYKVANKLPHDDVYITLDNGKIMHGWYFDKPGSKYTVIVHHGQGQNIAYFFPAAQVFHASGASVFLYDYEGFGRSQGPTNHEALRRDSEAAYMYVRNNRKVPGNRIVHCGISLGTGSACDIAARQPCAGVFLSSPYWRLSELGNQIVPLSRIYPRFCFPQPDIGADELVAKTKVPIMIIHGDNDPLIPCSNAYRIFNAASGPKHLYIVENGMHVGNIAPGVEDFCKNWLDSLPAS